MENKGDCSPSLETLLFEETSMTQTDEQLMLSVKDGNRDAFQVLTERHYANTLNFIYRFVKNQTLAEDLCQETFLRLWRCVPTYRPIAKFRTFLYHIAKNVCLKQLAKEQRTPQIESLDVHYGDDDENFHPIAVAIADTHCSPEALLIVKETYEAIQTAINKLSKEHQVVFQLTELQGLSYQEVAEIVQCPIGTVASRKNAAIRQLRKFLAPYRTSL
jgi:RNA polymerase sigma-70 factor (ECF subfamily)